MFVAPRLLAGRKSREATQMKQDVAGLAVAAIENATRGARAGDMIPMKRTADRIRGKH